MEMTYFEFDMGYGNHNKPPPPPPPPKGFDILMMKVIFLSSFRGKKTFEIPEQCYTVSHAFHAAGSSI